jgi:hypothetical protein
MQAPPPPHPHAHARARVKTRAHLHRADYNVWVVHADGTRNWLSDSTSQPEWRKYALAVSNVKDYPKRYVKHTRVWSYDFSAHKIRLLRVKSFFTCAHVLCFFAHVYCFISQARRGGSVQSRLHSISSGLLPALRSGSLSVRPSHWHGEPEHNASAWSKLDARPSAVYQTECGLH